VTGVLLLSLVTALIAVGVGFNCSLSSIGWLKAWSENS
jgi:hypothetical protein